MFSNSRQAWIARILTAVVIVVVIVVVTSH